MIALAALFLAIGGLFVRFAVLPATPDAAAIERYFDHGRH